MMLSFMKDDFDENADDILNSINKMLAKSKNKNEEDLKKEENAEK